MDKAIAGNVAPSGNGSVADETNTTNPALSTNPSLRSPVSPVITRAQDLSNQLQKATGIYKENNPKVDLPINAPLDQTKVQTDVPVTAARKVAMNATRIGANILTGIVKGTVAPVNYLNNKLGLASDQETQRINNKINSGDGIDLGLDKGYVENGDGNPVTNVVNDVAQLLPVIATSESSGGTSWLAQGLGNASLQVAKMKQDGVKFNKHSDDMFIIGSGLINYALGKSVAGTVIEKLAPGLQNDIIGGLAADATKGLADLGANATADDVANVYTQKALDFSQRLQQFGLGILKTYPKIATEFAGANILQSGVKAATNAVSGNKPMGEVTGAEIADDLAKPIVGDYKPGNNLSQNFSNLAGSLLTSQAAGLSLLHGAMTSGMLFDKSPYLNPVIKSLQDDNSPQNVEAVKQQIGKVGLEKGWTDAEINNTGATIDGLSHIVQTLPADLPPEQFHHAVDLIMGRGKLQNVLDEIQSRKGNLDAAISGKAAPFETMVKAKVDQINDQLSDLMTGEKYSYFEKNGKYFRQDTNGELSEINKARFDLEHIENQSRPEAEKSEVTPEEEKPAEKSKSETRPVAQEPASPVKTEPVIDKSLMDSLDDELDDFKQASPATEKTQVESTPITPETAQSNEKPTTNTPAKEETIESAKSVKAEPKKEAPKEANAETGDINAVNELLPQKGEDVTFQNKPYKVTTIIEDGKEKKYRLVDANGKEFWTNELSFTGKNKTAVRLGKNKFSDVPDNSTEKPYYIAGPDKIHIETPGKALLNDHGLDLFTHDFAKTGGKGFGVSEGSTGLSLGKGATEADAIDRAQELLKTKTPAEIQDIIKSKHENGLKSPRGIIEPQTKETQGSESSNTENTEAVITKATTTVGKAKDTKGTDPESASVIDGIDNSIADIDKELETLSKSTTPEHGLQEGDKVLYDERPLTVVNTDKTGVNFRNEETGLVERAAVHSVVNRDMATGKLTMDEDAEPEPEPTNEPPKEDKQERRKKYEQQLKDAKAAFMKTFNKAMSGINPETLEKGIKLIAVYAKIGIHDFKEIARDLAEDLGDGLRDIFEGLKASYGAFASQEASESELDLMTDIREVRKANIDEFIPKEVKNDTASKSNTVDEDTSTVDAGKSAGATPGYVQQQPAKGLPGSENDRSGTAGNEPESKPAKTQSAGDRQSGDRNDTSTGTGRAGRGPAERDNGSAVSENTSKRVIAPEDQNHIIKPSDTLVPAGAVGKFNANVDALFLLNKLEAENRNPTPAEKEQLAQFVGWGGLAKYLDTPNKPDNEAVSAFVNGKRTSFYDNRYNRVIMDFTDRGPMDINKYSSFNDLLDDARKAISNSGYSITPDNLRAPLLKSILSNEEYQAAQNSTINAHYTERAVIKNMWDITTKLGFKGGKVLESSAGIGHFFGLMPKEFSNKTSLQAYELDSITGRILKKLYPQSNTTVTGFENSRVPQNSVDLAIGNVPFAQTAPYDKSFPELSKFSMHNYFIAKNLKLLKPGGLGVMITSASTMDSPSSAKFREWVTSPDGGNSYLVGAIRLPSNAFSENAGTQVTTDMLVFQKKGQVVNADLEQPFRYTKYLKSGNDDKGQNVDLHVNEYYIEHPEQMIGDMMTAHEAGSGGLYGGNTPTLKASDNLDINKALQKATDVFPEDIAGNKTEPDEVKSEPITAIDKKEGSVFEKGDKFYKVTDGEGTPMELNPKQKYIAKAYTGLKSNMLSLIEQEQAVKPTGDLDKMRTELNKQYDDFVKKHGNINSRNTDFLNESDIDFPIVASLENIARSIEKSGTRDKIVQTITKGEILNSRVNYPRVEPEHAADIKDAINISLNYRTGLDINYMAKMLGEDPDTLRERLLDQELAYENPDSGILETPEEYLAGYVRDKLKKAEIASINDPKYLKNIAQLKKIIPEDIPSSLISYSLGSSWIPGHVYEDFAKDVMDTSIAVKYLERAGKWLVKKGYGWNSAQVQNTYAAGGLDGVDILEDTLNNKQIVVSDTIRNPDGTTKTVKNPEKTAAAQAMQQQLQEEFESFVKGNEPIQQETERIYNDIFNGQVLRTWRLPDFKHYPGASTTVSLREHQKKAVSRGLSESTLMAHEVGSGKAQPLDAKLLTPTGWLLMGDVKVGDDVISVDGLPTKVIGVFPQGEKEIFKVTFSDGSSTECCDEHLWLTQTYKERISMINEKRFGKDWPSCKPRVRTLNEIRHSLTGRVIEGHAAKNHSIPVTKPVQFNEQPLVIHPYLMGVILGDGSVRGNAIRFTSIDEEIINKVESVLPDGFTLTHLRDKKMQSYGICKPKGKYSSLIQEFKSEGIMNLLSFEKSIPEKYIFNSIENRIELLRGLLDTDGSVNKKSGSTLFYTSSINLMKGVKLLVETLGGTTSLSTKIPTYSHLGIKQKGRLCYMLHIKLPNEYMPFSLTRKLELVKPKLKYIPIRYIVSVESVGLKKAQCIKVNHPSHLYLTDDCIVTHNTYTIITTAMEMRRLGTARKPLIGVQNSTLSDFVSAFKGLYPSAKILAPSEKEMAADGRKRLFAKIATGDWDAIILPHSQITMIPDDPERQKAYIMEQIQEMHDTIATIDDYQERRKLTSEIKKLTQEMDLLTPGEDGKKASGKATAKKIGEKSLKITAQMEKALDRKTDNIFNFEQLGIDALLMDEAHKYKRLGFQTSMKNIKGIDTSKSQRSQSILLKSRWVQEKTGGKNVNFYTGTPISNTMAEAWTMIKYLRPDILEHMGIEYFDQFAKTFGQVIPSLEQTGGGTFKVQNRFAKFQNLPEFITAFRATTDVVLTDDVKEFQNTDTIPKLKDGKFTQVIIPQSPELKSQINDFKRTLEWFDKLSGREKKENSHVPLVIFNKAKQASIDLRLLDPTNVDSPQSKVNQAIENAVKIYKASSDKKGVQMIFSDMYQSPEPKNKYLDEDGFVVNPAYGKDRFNLFEDIKKKLVKAGVPADQIVIFTEPKYDKAERKKAVFADANSGKIRFLLGTTEKMGVGVNAQQKLIALHHLDAPARPMDFEQRNGRIIRQGNENKIVDVLTYGVEKTLDSSAFQRLSTKQKFINQIMKGQNLERVTEDPADEAQMTFDEMMAHLSDSPFAMQKLLVDNKLRSEMMKQQNFNQKIIRSNRILRDTESDIRNNRSKLEDQIKNAEIVRTKFPDGNITSLRVGDGPEAIEKFSEAADTYINKLIDNYDSSPTKFAKGGFYLNGVRVELEVANVEKLSRETGIVVNTPTLEYRVPEIGLTGESWNSRGYTIPSNSGAGLLASIRSKLNDVLVKPSETQAHINKDEKDVEQLKKDAQAKFDDSRIKTLTDESEALKVKMLADNKTTPPEDDNTPGGGQTTAEYIKDQANIKPALDFLDNMKAKNDGRFLSTIVPIPPAVWNGAIDVMKNILKATNSTQKAIRVAARYIIDRGGTEAQAKDFESTMTDKMANTSTGKRATVADSDDTHSEEVMIKAAGELRDKLKSTSLSPDEKALTQLDLNTLTKKELHRYIEVTSVLAVDPQGVLTKDVTDLTDRVNNRISPRSGTAVPPEEPPLPPEDGNDSLMGDDEAPRRRIPKKNKLPMDEVPVPETDPTDNTIIGKANYSIWGNLKDIHVRNLEQLKKYGQDMTNMDGYRSMIQLASSKSQSNVAIGLASDKINKLIGADGYTALRQALMESRLRGTKQRFIDFGTSVKRASDNDLDDLFDSGKESSMYNIIKSLEGYEEDENPAQTIVAMLNNGEYDDAREYMSDMFDNAADNVAFYGKLSNGKTFDEMVQDGGFVDPKFQQAFEQYKNFIEKPFRESHETNDGIFSDALGPLNTYYPLSPMGRDAHKVAYPSKTKYVAPENINNKFTTGSADAYSSAISDLSRKLSVSLKTNNKAAAIRAIEDAGLVAKVSADDNSTKININGVEYAATKVPIADARTIIANNQVIHSPIRYILIPTFLHKEIKPLLEGQGDEDRDPYTVFGHMMNASINLMLGGPGEAVGHSYRLLSSVINSMPYMQEWAYKNGILGHAAGLAINNPIVKVWAAMGKVLFTNSDSEAFANDVMEMAKLGLIPEKTWTHTYSKQFAESRGIEPTQFPLPYKDLLAGNFKKAFTKGKFLDFSPVLYGQGGFDLKARVVMYRLVKAMNPDATPEQHIKMQADMGQYTQSLQGRLEKFVKRNGLGPFATFSRAYYRAGLKNITGSTPLPFNSPFTNSFNAGDKASAGKFAYYKFAQMISGGALGLVAYWMYMHHLLTGRYPDKHTGLLKIPMPDEFKKNKYVKSLYLNKRTGEWDDISLGFANVVADRGLKAVGAYKGYDAYRFGGTTGQISEAAQTQAINTYASQYTASPAVSLGFTGLTGDAPYITGIHNYRGQVEPSFLRKAATAHAGLQYISNLGNGFMGINGLFSTVNPMSGTLSDDYDAEDYESGKFWKSIANIGFPNMFTAHGTDKTKYTKQNEKAIETTIKKEEAKKHHK